MAVGEAGKDGSEVKSAETFGSLNRIRRGVGMEEPGKDGSEVESASRLLAYHRKMGLTFALPLRRCA